MASATMKDEFRNETKGFVGVITLDNGKERGVAVRPESTIWLSEAEQVLTANAPRRDEDNPFINGQLKLVTKAQDVKNRRPLGNQVNPEDLPANGTDTDSDAEEAGPVVVEAPKPVTTRQKEDRERAKAEVKRKAEAEAQAKSGAVPGRETGAALDAAGTPKPKGRAAENEEVATPDAPAVAEKAAKG